MDELEIVTRFFILHIFARYVYVLPNYAFCEFTMIPKSWMGGLSASYLQIVGERAL